MRVYLSGREPGCHPGYPSSILGTRFTIARCAVKAGRKQQEVDGAPVRRSSGGPSAVLARIAQLARALPRHGRGRRFEPCFGYHLLYFNWLECGSDKAAILVRVQVGGLYGNRSSVGPERLFVAQKVASSILAGYPTSV